MNLLPAESKVLAFVAHCENCHLPEKVCQCDTWVGCCSSCGTEVYGGEEHRMEDDKPICGECLAEEREWNLPAVAARKAA